MKTKSIKFFPTLFVFYLSLLFHQTQGQTFNCFQAQFPKLFGSALGATSFYAVDIDPSQNLLIGAASDDPNMINISDGIERPLVVFLSNTGSYDWYKRIITNVQARPLAMKFNHQTYSRVLLALDTDPLQLMIIQASDGALLYTFEFQASFSYRNYALELTQDSFLYDSQGGIFLSFTGDNGGSTRLLLSKFTLGGTGDLTSDWDITISPCLPGATMTFGSDEDSFLLARIHHSSRIMFHKIQRDGTVLKSVQDLSFNFYAKDYSVKTLSFFQDTLPYYHGCGDSSIEAGIVLFSLRDDNPFLMIERGFHYKDASDGLIKCKDLLSLTKDQAFYLVESDTKALLLGVDYSVPSIAVRARTSLLKGVSLCGVFNPVTKIPLFLGTSPSVFFFDQTVGYIMSFDSEIACTSSLFDQGQIFSDTGTGFDISSGLVPYYYVSVPAAPETSTTSNQKLKSIMLPYADISDTYTFETFQSYCDGDQYTIRLGDTISTVNYMIGTGTQVRTYQDFTLVEFCPDFVAFNYKAYYLEAGLYTETFPVFTTVSLPTFTVTIDTTDLSLGGTSHDFVIRGSLPNAQYNGFTYKINILDCSLTPNAPIFNDTYSIGKAVKTIPLSTYFTVGDSKCSPLSLTITNQDGSAYDSNIFTIANGNLYVLTSDQSKVGTINLNVRGQYGIYQDATFLLSIVFVYLQNACVLDGTNMRDSEYRVSIPTQLFQIPSFTDDQECNQLLYYYATLGNGHILPSFINLNQGGYFSVHTLDDNNAKTYEILITAEVIGEVSDTISWILKVIKEKENKTPPRFKTEIGVIEIMSQQPAIYELPEYGDEENDVVLMNIDYKGNDFINQSSGILYLNPQDKDVGTREIILTLSDDGEPPLKMSYVVKIIVLEAGQPSKKNITSTSSRSKFVMNIWDISNYGEVDIRFNVKVKIPEDIKSLDNEVISVTIKKSYLQGRQLQASEGDSEAEVEFDWEIIELTNSGMVMQLLFEDPDILYGGQVIIYQMTFYFSLFTI